MICEASEKSKSEVIRMKQEIPLSEKYLLTIPEAVLYFGIGEKKMRLLIDSHIAEDKSFVIMNGSKYLIIRRRFENFLDNTQAI